MYTKIALTLLACFYTMICAMEKQVQEITLDGEIQQVYELMEALEFAVNEYFDLTTFLFDLPGIASHFRTHKSQHAKMLQDAREMLKNPRAKPEDMLKAQQDLAEPPPSASRFFTEKMILKFIDYLALDKIPVQKNPQAFSLTSPQLGSSIKTLNDIFEIANLKALLIKINTDYFARTIIPDKPDSKLREFLQELSQSRLVFDFETTDPHTDWSKLKPKTQEDLLQRKPGLTATSPEFKRFLNEIKKEAKEKFALEPGDLVRDWHKLSRSAQQGILRRMNAVEYIKTFKASFKSSFEIDTSVINLDGAIQEVIKYYKTAKTIEFDKVVDLLQFFKYLGIDVEEKFDLIGIRKLITDCLQGNPIGKKNILDCIKFNALFKQTKDASIREELNHAMHGSIALILDFIENNENKWPKLFRALALYDQAHKNSSAPQIPFKRYEDEKLLRALYDPASSHTNLISFASGASAEMLESLFKLNDISLGHREALYEALFVAVKNQRSRQTQQLLKEISRFENKQLLANLSSHGLAYPNCEFSFIKETCILSMKINFQTWLEELNALKKAYANKQQAILMELLVLGNKEKVATAICTLFKLKAHEFLEAMGSQEVQIPKPIAPSVRSVFTQKAATTETFDKIDSIAGALWLAKQLNNEQVAAGLLKLLQTNNQVQILDSIGEAVFSEANAAQIEKLTGEFLSTQTMYESEIINRFKLLAEKEGCGSWAQALLASHDMSSGMLLEVLAKAAQLGIRAPEAFALLQEQELQAALHTLESLSSIVLALREHRTSEAYNQVVKELQATAEILGGQAAALDIVRNRKLSIAVQALEIISTLASELSEELPEDLWNNLIDFVMRLNSVDISTKRALLLKDSCDPFIITLAHKDARKLIDMLLPRLDLADRDAFFWWALTTNDIIIEHLLTHASRLGISALTLESAPLWAAHNDNIELAAKLITLVPQETKTKQALLYWAASRAVQTMNNARSSTTQKKNLEEQAQAYESLYALILSRPGIEPTVIDHVLLGALAQTTPEDEDLSLDPIVRDCTGWGQILKHAIQYGYQNLTRFLLALNMQQEDWIIKSRSDALENALAKGDMELIRPFLAWPVSSALQEKILLLAARHNITDIAFFLLKEPINLQVIDDSKRTALDWVLSNDNKELLEKIVKVNTDKAIDEKICCFAAKRGYVELFLEVNSRTAISRTSLEQAFEEAEKNKQMEILYLLVKALPGKGLEWAASEGSLELVKSLFEENFKSNPEPNMPNIRIAFVLAAQHGYLKIVEYLVKMVTIDPFKEPQPGGVSAFQQAKESIYVPVIKFLTPYDRSKQ